jgi:hypothetical protein
MAAERSPPGLASASHRIDAGVGLDDSEIATYL